MGDKTKIDWCDATWNPVTGCLHGCEYCYARRIAKRFCSNEHGKDEAGIAYPCGALGYRNIPEGDCRFCSELDGLEFVGQGIRWNHGRAAYPYGFMPTFHPHRLDVPQRWKKPRTIFVCSMADLFGEWVPDKCIQQVFDACREAPQHRYIFLSKAPERFIQLHEKGIMFPENSWIGTSVTRSCEAEGPSNRISKLTDTWRVPGVNWFVSIEPILEDLSLHAIATIAETDWVIIGAETGKRKGKVVPEKRWIDRVCGWCRNNRVPIFMKESLREIMGTYFKQEFPWEVG